MVTDNYTVGDLIKFTPADVVYTFSEVDCESGPPEPNRFGLVVEDNVLALLIETKEDPDYGGQLMFLVGNQKCYMTYHPPGNKPYLNVINKT